MPDGEPERERQVFGHDAARTDRVPRPSREVRRELGQATPCPGVEGFEGVPEHASQYDGGGRACVVASLQLQQTLIDEALNKVPHIAAQPIRLNLELRSELIVRIFHSVGRQQCPIHLRPDRVETEVGFRP